MKDYSQQQKKYNVGLFFLPNFNMSHVYLSLPVLSSYLTSKGIENTQVDLNIDSLEYFMSDKFLERSYNRYIQENGFDLYSNIKVTMMYEFLKHNNNNVFKIIKNNLNFKKKTKYLFVKTYISQLYQFISNIYKPFSISLDSFNSPYENNLSVIIDLSVDKKNFYIDFFNKVIKEKKFYELDFIGISLVCYSQILPTFTFCKILKNLNPKIKICLGGNVFTKIKYKLNEIKSVFDYIDYIIVHEGEESLYKLITTLKEKKDISNVNNLIYICNEEIIQNPCAVSHMKLDELPLPNFDDFNLNKYLSPGIILPFYISRSCYWGKCSFCDHDYGYDGVYKIKSIKKIIDELKQLKVKYNMDMIYFVDEAIPIKILVELSKELLKNNLDIKWFAYIKPDIQYSKKICQLLYDAGCKYLMTGIESCSKDLLDHMNKGVNLDDISTTIENMNSSGIWLHLFLIHNYPIETSEDILKTLIFINEHNSHSIGISQFILTYNSKLIQKDKILASSPLKQKNDLSSVVEYKKNYTYDSKVINYTSIVSLYNKGNKFNRLFMNYCFDSQHIPLINSKYDCILNKYNLKKLLDSIDIIERDFFYIKLIDNVLYLYSTLTGIVMEISQETADILEQIYGLSTFKIYELLSKNIITNEEKQNLIEFIDCLFKREDS